MQFKYRNNLTPRFNVDLGGLVHLYKLSGAYFVTTIINQALPFLILPILTRYLSPAEYGNIALFSFYLLLSNSLTGISITTVISKHFFNEEKENIARIIGNSIMIVALLSVITMILILILYAAFPSIIQLSLIWLLLIPFASFAFVIFSMGLSVMQNSRKVISFGRHQIGNTAINLFISIVLIVTLMWGWHGRLWGIILSYFLSAIASYYYLKKNGFISYDFSGKIIKTILKVLIPLIPNSFQSVIISQVGIFFIQYYFSKELLGLYSIGFQIAVMIYLLIVTLSMSWTPYLYEQISDGKEINKLYLTRLLWALIGILIAGVLFVNLTSGIVLKLMTTPAFFNAREFIPWFTLGFFFFGVYVFLSPILIKHEKQKFISMITFLNMFFMIVLNFWFVKLFGYIGIAYAFCLTYLLMLLPLFWMAQRVMPLPWLKALKIWN